MRHVNYYNLGDEQSDTDATLSYLLLLTFPSSLCPPTVPKKYTFLSLLYLFDEKEEIESNCDAIYLLFVVRIEVISNSSCKNENNYNYYCWSCIDTDTDFAVDL